MTPDVVHGYQSAGDWIAHHWPWLAIAAAVVAVWAIRRYLRRKPAAPDNVPPQDTAALWICRRIAALPLTDPDVARPANAYLRDPGEETP